LSFPAADVTSSSLAACQLSVFGVVWPVWGA
jgi:hypothetical protein